jgi:hypothetical protein
MNVFHCSYIYMIEEKRISPRELKIFFIYILKQAIRNEIGGFLY